MSAAQVAIKKSVTDQRRIIARESNVPIEKFFYFGKNGSVFVQDVGTPAYTQRRRRNAAKELLKEEGLPIPEALDEPISAYPAKPSFLIPHIEQMLEPFEVPTKEHTKEPWALIVPPSK